MLSQDITNSLIDIVGHARCLDRPEELACYSYDAFLVEAQPEVVIFPKKTSEVSQVLSLASKHRIPVTARGAGTSVCGGPVPVNKGIVVCFSQMNQILEINTRDRYVTVQPGVINGELQQALAPSGFFYPPDPSSLNIATIGGNVALNAGGPRCLKYGVTMDYILGIEAVLASGKVVRFGSKNIKDVTGYRMASLFCGSEGTLGLVTEVTLRVMPQPQTTQTILVTFNELDHCASAVSDIIGSGILPAALELMDKISINAIEDALHIGLPQDAAGILLIDVDGIREACEKERGLIIEKVQQHGAVEIQEARTQEEREKLWHARRAAYGVFAKIAPDILSEDVTVPVSRVPEMIRKVQDIAARNKLLIGVIAHAGDGNMHPLIMADRDNREEWKRVEKACAEIFAAAAELGGTLSGEHGIGLAKEPFLPLVMDQDSRDLMATVKKVFDPEGILNPGKFV